MKRQGGRMTRFYVLLPMILGLWLISDKTMADSSPAISFEKGWVRAVPPVSKMTAAYLTLFNYRKQDDTLLHVSSPAAESVEIHNVVSRADGSKAMVPVPHLTLAGESCIQFKPGGYHIMLVGLKAPLKVGALVKLELVFQNAGKVVFELPVSSMGDDDEHGHHHH